VDDEKWICASLTGAQEERARLQGLMLEFARKAGVTVPAVEGLSLPELWKVTGAKIEGHGLFDILDRFKRALRRDKPE
jgi:hypothetical protein